MQHVEEVTTDMSIPSSLDNNGSLSRPPCEQNNRTERSIFHFDDQLLSTKALSATYQQTSNVCKYEGGWQVEKT